MRMRGQSYTEISNGLGMSKSTLSGWFKHLVIPKEAQEKINNRSHAASINALLKINKLQTHKAQERARTIRATNKKALGSISKHELLLIGVALYWAEGFKKTIIRDGKPRTAHPVSFTNSDAAMVKMFLRFLRESCSVMDEKITVDVRIFEHQNEAHILQYWSTVTQLPFGNFRKVYRGVSISSQHKRPYNTLPYGTIQIRVNDTALFHKIMGWIEGLQNS